MFGHAPFPRLAKGAWIYSATGWTAGRVLWHLLHPSWYEHLADTAAVAALLCAVIARIMTAWHRDVMTVRLDRIEDRIRGYDASLSHFFPEPVTPHAATAAALVPAAAAPDAPPATSGSGTDAVILAFPRPESPR